MRILEIMSGHGVNGAVVHCLLLTRQLAARGHHVMLVCRHNAWIAQQVQPEVAAGTVTVVESDMSRWPFHELKRVAGVARDLKIDVANTHMTRAHNFGVFLRHFSGIPCVATAHSHKVHWHWLMADRIIAVSDATRRYHRRKNFIPPSRIETVHGFIDASRFAPCPPEARAALRRDLGAPEDALLIGAIGDFLPRKAQHYLVRALPSILAAVPNAWLALAGSVRDKKYEQLVRHEVQKQGVADRVLWLGYRQDVPQLLNALDVYVLGSLDEMFPVALLEAMAAGQAIVATAVGGTPECVPEPGAVTLIPPANPEALSQAIRQLLCDADLRAQMGEAARDTVCRHFTVEAQTPKIETAFARAIQSQRERKQGIGTH
jgi:glycosyltransferase involved in cell wall biosynthesis